MKIKKGLYNVFFGFMGQIITIALGIVIPRLFIVNLGSAANGLLSSIGQVLSYLTLLEAGLGGASIQALYKPLANNDTDRINAILAATSDYYRRTGKIYVLCVIGISAIYPFFVKDFSYSTTFFVIALAGIPGAINYYYQGKFRVLLTAEGKSYIVSNITTFISVITSISKIILILCGCNLIHLQIAYCCIALVQVIIYHFLFKKSYQWVDYNVSPDYSSISQKKSVLIHQISNLVLTNTDVIILTIFTDLKVVSVYTVYNMIFDMINTSVQTVGNSVSYIFGESYNKNREKFKTIYGIYETYFFAFTFALYTIAFIMIKPFLILYTKGVSDISYIDSYLPILFTAMKLLACSRTPSQNIINVVGMFRETQRSAIIEAAINLTVSIIAVYNFGIYGVVVGTIVALLYRAVYLVVFANKRILSDSPIRTLKRWGTNVGIFIFIMIVYSLLPEFSIGNYLIFAVTVAMYFLVICFCYVVIDSVIDYKNARIVKNVIVSKLHKERSDTYGK